MLYPKLTSGIQGASGQGGQGVPPSVSSSLGPLFFSTAYCLHGGPGALKSKVSLDEHFQRVNLGSSARQEWIWASDHPVLTLPGTPQTFHPRAPHPRPQGP